MMANGPIPPKLGVLHRCDTPACCNLEHLFLGSQADNMRDASRKGRFRDRRGELHHKAKLSEAQVREIRALRSAGVENAEIGRRFGITTDHAYMIVTRKIWRHI